MFDYLQDRLGDFGIAFALVAVFFPFLNTLRAYNRNSRLQRAKHFNELNDRFLSDSNISNICRCLIEDDPELLSVHYDHKAKFLRFYEEIAIARNSRLINRRLAHYMFGFYAIKCVESTHFWDFNEEGTIAPKKSRDYWRLFFLFADDMRREAREFDVESKLPLFRYYFKRIRF